jgi:hypothetical protein
VRQRIALWGALAAIVVAAGVLAVFVAGGDGEGPPGLPLAAAGGDGAGDARAESAVAAPAADIAPAFVYVPGEGLPALGDEAPAYRLAGHVTKGDVERLAGELDIDGEPTKAGDAWHVDDGETSLDVYGTEGAWSAYRMVIDPSGAPEARSGAGTSSSSGSGSSGAVSNSAGGGEDEGAASVSASDSAGGRTIDAETVSDVQQVCPGTTPGADNVVSLCEPPFCPTSPAADPPADCTPICLEQPDAVTDGVKPCTPPMCPQYDNATGGGGAARTTADAAIPCPGPICPDTPAAEFRCIPPTPPSTTPPSPGDPVPDPLPTPTTTITVPPTTVPAPPPGMPSEDEAKSAARDLAEAVGLDVDGAAVTAENLVSTWSVTVEPQVGGLPAPGLTMYVGVGPEGRIDSASGQMADPDELGDYPMIDTRDALTRLNEGWDLLTTQGDAGAKAAAEDDSADDAAAGANASGAAAPPETPPPTLVAPGGEPQAAVETVPPLPGDTPVTGPVHPTPVPPGGGAAEVEVTDAEVVLVTVPSWDGSGTYLVPGYRFTAEDGSTPTVPAVTDDALQRPEG